MLHTLMSVPIVIFMVGSLLATIIPLAEPYALGLVLLGVAPCSPAIPVMMRR